MGEKSFPGRYLSEKEETSVRRLMLLLERKEEKVRDESCINRIIRCVHPRIRNHANPIEPSIESEASLKMRYLYNFEILRSHIPYQERHRGAYYTT